MTDSKPQGYKYSGKELAVAKSIAEGYDLPYVITRKNNAKVSIDDWRDVKGKEAATKHLPHAFGLIPGEMKCVVIDVDNADGTLHELLAKYPPHAFLKSHSSPYKGHLYYHVSDRMLDRFPNNFKFDFGGDFRSMNGYVVVWHPDRKFLEFIDDLEWGVLETKDIIVKKLINDHSTKPPTPKKPKTGEVAETEQNNADGLREIVRGQGTANAEMVRQMVHCILRGDGLEPAIENALEAGIPEDEVAAAAKWAEENVGPDLIGELDGEMLIKAIALLGIQMCYCVRSGKRLFSEDNGLTWARYADRHMADMRKRMEKAFKYQQYPGSKVRPLRFTENDWRLCCDQADKITETDFVMDYIEECHKQHADKVGDITIFNWATHLFGVGETAYDQYAQSLVFIGGAQRTLHPGAKIRAFPVLVGGTGIGKSHLVRALLPTHLNRYLSESFDLGMDPNKQTEIIEGKFAAELAEMTGATRAEASSLKAYLNHTKSEMRKAYRKDAEEIPHTHMFVGTANHGAFLPEDPVASKRFLPLQCTKGGDVETFMNKHRDSLLAQAWTAVLECNDIEMLGRLPAEVRRVHDANTNTHRSGDPVYHEAYDKLVHTLEHGGELLDMALLKFHTDWGDHAQFTPPFYHSTLVDIAFEGANCRSLQKFYQVMREDGWKEVILDTRKGRRWLPPDDLAINLPKSD